MSHTPGTHWPYTAPQISAPTHQGEPWAQTQLDESTASRSVTGSTGRPDVEVPTYSDHPAAYDVAASSAYSRYRFMPDTENPALRQLSGEEYQAARSHGDRPLKDRSGMERFPWELTSARISDLNPGQPSLRRQFVLRPSHNVKAVTYTDRRDGPPTSTGTSQTNRAPAAPMEAAPLSPRTEAARAAREALCRTSLENLGWVPTLSFTPAGQWQRNERNELPLAGYLLARAIDGRPVDDLERLRSANDTVLQTRELLRFGRGNVRSDIEATDSESRARLLLGRAIADDAYTPLGRADVAAATIFTGAGSCGEHACVAVHLHATKLSEPGDLLFRASASMADHAWGQLQSLPRGNDDAIVMDTWAEGPAVHASDSHYAHDPKSFESPWSLDRASGTDMVARIPGIMESMAKDASKSLAAYLESSKANPLSGENLFEPEPVIHAAFSERVKRKMAEPVVVDEALAQQAAGKPSAPKGLFSKIKPALSDPFRKKAKAKERFAARQVEVRNDIKAIGVARSLGRATTVKEAVRQAPEIVDAARNLQQARRTDQVREFLLARQESSRH